MLTRGIRNNNPGNIRRGSRWLGLSAVQNDKEFCSFSSMEYGIRALLITLRTYYNKHHCDTVRKVISRFAPSNENNTEKYIKFVCDYLKIAPDSFLSQDDLFMIAYPVMIYESRYSVPPLYVETIVSIYNL